MNKKHGATASDRQRGRAVAVSAIAASVVMLVFGIGYRVLAARLSDPVNTVPLNSVALEQLPTRLGDWTGQDVPIDAAIVRRADTDGYVNRRYSRYGDAESVGLYIAYGVRARALMPHRPEVCYPGAGWTRIDQRSIELPLSSGLQLPCRILEFSRGTLNLTKILILNYYIVDGRYGRDVSLLRSKVWRGSATIAYAAQVQIVASVAENTTADSVARMVCDFAVESASSIFALFEDTAGSQVTDDRQVDADRKSGGAASG